MASFSYFADIAGQAFELSSVRHNGGSGTHAKNFSGTLPTGERVTATRVIERKPRPSLHECDARCMNATGRVMRCECSCNGKNHGRGAFMCEA